MKLTSTIYACLAVTSTLATEQNRTGDWPKRLDVELVYPRNTTYPSQNVLPVVFAIHNPAAFWPYHFNFTWDLDIKVSPNEAPIELLVVASIGSCMNRLRCQYRGILVTL
jgi:hypothetical protein